MVNSQTVCFSNIDLMFLKLNYQGLAIYKFSNDLFQNVTGRIQKIPN